MRNCFFLALLLNVGSIFAQNQPVKPLAKLPGNTKLRNVIFILADDHRYDFMSFMKPAIAPWLETPNLDRIRREGALPQGVRNDGPLFAQSRQHSHGSVFASAYRRGQRRARAAYTTYVLTDYAVNWMKGRDQTKPFFLYLSHKAVYHQFYPGRGDWNRYAGKPIQYPPSFYQTSPKEDNPEVAQTGVPH